MVSPRRESDINSRVDSPNVSEHQQRRKDDARELNKDCSRSQYGRDSYRQSDRYSSRGSHGYSGHDEYRRREKRVDDEERHYLESSHSGHKVRESEHRRSREYLRSDEKYYRDKYDSSQPGSKEKDRHDRNNRHEKRDYHRSFGDNSDGASKYVESKGYKKDSGVHYEGLRLKESYRTDQEEPNGQEDGKKPNDRESVGKKPKLFRSGWDAKEGNNANEEEKQIPEADGKATCSEVGDDLNAAKVAALKAAELVNRNLGGVGFMSTEQKKKLLWGNKKSSTSQEQPGNRFVTPLFDDRERQEKFNKLMGVKGEVNVEQRPEQVEKQKEVQLDLEKQYTAGLRRRDGRTVGLGL